ncbi:hypothetical protein QTL86_19385 [Cellulosilyticum sp. ST5]|uniref:hypothetical protein n=1 Tax=unclassified Cellulosilyticum TaxID=2643091 RepID=UPI000F8CE840|nr:hypothetical protein [Cellulosilyticum sp. WCF-2]QEH67252.1 hypothetical protein EKH84_01905 [Cellulosilyticum sp. WCF-2]QEH69905.1 hypothetical protein EKH84_16495 [Cellulosilyticum sp. WCF-2]
MERLLICKDVEQNTILIQQQLDETENITYSIIDNPPVIELVEGKIGKYSLDTEGNIIVVYEDVPKSEVELLKEDNEALKQAVTELSMIVSTLMS